MANKKEPKSISDTIEIELKREAEQGLSRWRRLIEETYTSGKVPSPGVIAQCGLALGLGEDASQHEFHSDLNLYRKGIKICRRFAVNEDRKQDTSRRDEVVSEIKEHEDQIKVLQSELNDMRFQTQSKIHLYRDMAETIRNGRVFDSVDHLRDIALN